MTFFAPSPNQSAIQTALRSFLVQILPAGVEIVEGQDNRVPEPSSADYIVMTTIRRERLETNIDIYADCAFTASIAGTALTVSAMIFGAIAVGNALFGAGVASGTTIVSQSSGTPGGVGVYTVSASQTVASEKMATGAQNLLQPVKVTVQLDIHSANVQDAADMAQTISTLLRDDYAFAQFGLTSDIVPLHADDPKQIPFLNAEQQYETRYVVEAQLQVNQTVTVPQQFADQVVVTTLEVEANYSP